jgi:hypothetical protein
LLPVCGPLANNLALKWRERSPSCIRSWCRCHRLLPLSGNESLRPSLWCASRMPQMSWLVDTTLQRIMLTRGFSMAGSTVFFSWPEFSARPALRLLCENTNLLSWGWLWCQGKYLEDVVMAGDHLILGPNPPLKSLLWSKL